jgi:hypothetical protein
MQSEGLILVTNVYVMLRADSITQVNIIPHELMFINENAHVREHKQFQ